jgi:hypothetical protein
MVGRILGNEAMRKFSKQRARVSWVVVTQHRLIDCRN